MMRKNTIYLDTSVISALFDERTPERKALTREFWEKDHNYEKFLSEITVNEINAATESLRNKMNQEVENIPILPLTVEIELLANEYIKNEIFPEKYRNDALHISVATINEIEYLLSWNFRHLVKVKTRRLVNLINELKGYSSIEIIAPPEL